MIDHVANTDPGFAVPDKLHRIDPAAARAELEGAGFKFNNPQVKSTCGCGSSFQV